MPVGALPANKFKKSVVNVEPLVKPTSCVDTRETDFNSPDPDVKDLFLEQQCRRRSEQE